MRRRPVLPSKRSVWRITPDAPLGRWVDPETERDDGLGPDEHYEPNWRQSSFDLAFGLEVRDASDTVPGELLDELFKEPPR
jgi:hypothetical protein